MEKPVTYGRQGFVIEKLSSILTQTLPTNQLFLLISHLRLTEVIEALERIGITGDLAIFMLAYYQKEAT